MPNIFADFIQGRQAGQAEQDRARAIQQQELQNQFAMRDQQMQEQQFSQQQDALNREQKFNQLAAGYLGNETVGTLGVPTSGGPPAQAVDESQGPPQYAPQTQAGPSGPQPISQLIGLDPTRAIELEKVRTSRIQQQQGQIYNLASRALKSGKPAAMFRYLLGADTIGDLNVKALRDNLTEQGVDIKSMDDETATNILQSIAARSAAAAGIQPKDDFTLGKDDTRFTGDGTVLASGAVGSTDDIKEYEYAKSQGYAGSFDDFQLQLKRAGASNINLPAAKYPNKFQEVLAEADGKRLDKYQQNSDAANDLVKTLDKLQELSPTALAGGKAEQRAEVANWIQGFTGLDVVDPKILADTQNYNSLVSRAVLDRLGGSLGTGVSNADVTFIKDTVPKLAYSRQAREALISYLRMRAGEQVDLSERAREYAERTGGLKGFKAYENPDKKDKAPQSPTDLKSLSNDDLLKRLGH